MSHWTPALLLSHLCHRSERAQHFSCRIILFYKWFVLSNEENRIGICSWNLYFVLNSYSFPVELSSKSDWHKPLLNVHNVHSDLCEERGSWTVDTAPTQLPSSQYYTTHSGDLTDDVQDQADPLQCERPGRNNPAGAGLCWEAVRGQENCTR